MGNVILVTLGAFLGGVTIRMTGVGFALVALPFLLIALGPQDTVGILLIAASLLSVVMLVVWHEGIEWRRALHLALWSVIGAVPGTLLLAVAPERALELAIGVAAIVSLVGVLRVPRGVLTDTVLVRASGGLAVGFATAAAALGAAPLSVYSRLIDWESTRLAISVQPIFVITAVPFLVLRALFGMSAVPSLPPDIGIALVAGAIVGLVIGTLLARRVPVVVAEWLQFTVALGGSLIAVIRAVILWNA